MKKEHFIEVSVKRFGNNLSYDKLPDEVNHGKIELRCKTHGAFEVFPRAHLASKEGCSECYKDTMYDIKLEKCKIKFNNKFTYTKLPNRKDIGITCPNHGYMVKSFKTHYHSVTGCHECGLQNTHSHNTMYATKDELLDELYAIYKNKYVFNITIFNSKATVVNLTCKKHGTTEMSVSRLLRGNGCRRCSYDARILAKKELTLRLDAIYGDEYIHDLANYVNVRSTISAYHKKCKHSFPRVVRKHLEGQTCPRCKISKGEALVASILDILGIKFEREYIIPKSDTKYRYDFYLPELKLLIEYDGSQHFKKTNYWGAEEKLRKTRISDHNKNILARDYDYSLIRLPYTHFKTLDKYLLHRLRDYCKYRYNGTLYKNFLTLCQAENLSLDTQPRDLKQYLLKNILKDAHL